MSPANGAFCVCVDTGSLFQRIGGIWYRPFNELGYSERATDTGSVAAGAPVALSGLTVTFTVPASRRVQVRLSMYGANGTGGDQCFVRVMEGGTEIGLCRSPIATTSNVSSPITIVRTVTPAAGSHTYTVTTQQTSNSAVYPATSPSAPMTLSVCDVGAA